MAEERATKEFRLFGENIVVEEKYPGEFEQKIFLTEKELKESDISQCQNRLHVPKTIELFGLLTPEELELLNSHQSVEVPTVDPRGKTYNMTLKQWKSVESRNKLVLISEWAKLIEANGLETGDSVQLWGYRYKSRLYFNVEVIKHSKSKLGALVCNI